MGTTFTLADISSASQGLKMLAQLALAATTYKHLLWNRCIPGLRLKVGTFENPSSSSLRSPGAAGCCPRGEVGVNFEEDWELGRREPEVSYH
jgi:hypothetical protein